MKNEHFVMNLHAYLLGNVAVTRVLYRMWNIVCKYSITQFTLSPVRHSRRIFLPLMQNTFAVARNDAYCNAINL